MNSQAVFMRMLVSMGIVSLLFLARCGGRRSQSFNNPPPPPSGSNPPPPPSGSNPIPTITTMSPTIAVGGGAAFNSHACHLGPSARETS
jgi:hypothetical protein